jgi:hypothetical protein
MSQCDNACNKDFADIDGSFLERWALQFRSENMKVLERGVLLGFEDTDER